MILITKKLIFLLIGLCFIGQSWAQGLEQPAYTKSEVQELENNLSQKIKTNISEYLDNGAGFSVSVNLQLKRTSIPSAKPKVADTSPKDMGYLIVPAVSNDPAIERTPASQITYEIQSATVNVFVYTQYPDKFLKNIRAIIKSVTDGQSFSSNIKFSYLPAPPPKVIPPTEAEKEKVTPPVQPKGFWDYLRENSIPAAIILGALFFGIAIIIGITVFSNFFKSSAVAVAESIKEMNKAAPKEASANKADVAPITEESNSDSFERNIKIVASIIEKSPHVFTGAISERNNDYSGLKKLIPNLVASGEIQIQDLFSENTILKIEENAEQAKAMSTGEFYSWLDHFVERLTLNHLKKGNRFTRIIDRDIVNHLYGIESEKLTSYALNKNSGLVFKLVMDFLPPDSAKNLFERLTPEQWELVLDDRDINAENMNLAAKNLFQEISAMKQEDTFDVNSKKALEEVLIAPISSYLYSKALADYDECLAQIIKVSPGISHKIQERIWSPSLIHRVPAEYLKKKLININLTDREYLLIGFSEELSSLLSQYIPEGKMKQVLLDGIAKSQGKHSKEKLAAAEIFCKKFLNSLRESCQRGDFGLIEEEKTVYTPDSVSDSDIDIKEAA